MNRNRIAMSLATLIVFLSFSFPAFAHIPCRCNNPPDQCTCFIQLGDQGLAVEKIISRLKDKGYLDKKAAKSTFNPEVKQAILQFQTDNNLERTGWMDDETLDALCKGVLPEDSTSHSIEFWDSICFVPTDGGKKHHSDPTCSGMLNPRMISRVNAMSLGILPCRKDSCSKSTPLTYSSLGLTPRELPASYYETELSEADAGLLRTLPSDEVESAYIGNKKSKVFHKSTCSSVSSMSEKNKVSFSSREEAIGKEYKPCGKCNP